MSRKLAIERNKKTTRILRKDIEGENRILGDALEGRIEKGGQSPGRWHPPKALR